ncbi:hypothetical protein JCM15764A_32570 [Geotalea toluenoxydans]
MSPYDYITGRAGAARPYLGDLERPTDLRMSVNLPVPLWQRGIQGDLPLRDIENPPLPPLS